MENRWILYILECNDGTLYTGITDDLNKRIQMHSSGKGAKYTRGRGPFRLRFSFVCESRSDALKKEIHVKKMTRQKKLQLCDGDNTDLLLD